jgi:hypothetical protein
VVYFVFFWDVSDVPQVRKQVRTPLFAIEPERPIPIPLCVPGPIPASASFVDFDELYEPFKISIFHDIPYFWSTTKKTSNSSGVQSDSASRPRIRRIVDVLVVLLG